MNWNQVDQARRHGLYGRVLVGVTITFFAPRHAGIKGVLPNCVCDANQLPLLSKEGKARSAGVVCSKSRSILIDAREALLIKTVRYAAICKERAPRGL